jgi:hypothetical protein
MDRISSSNNIVDSVISNSCQKLKEKSEELQDIPKTLTELVEISQITSSGNPKTIHRRPSVQMKSIMDRFQVNKSLLSID